MFTKFEFVVCGRENDGRLTGKKGVVKTNNAEELEAALIKFHGPRLAAQEIPEPEVDED